MASIITLGAGNDFTANGIGFNPPVASGLLGWYWPGISLTKNFWNAAAPAGATGSPTQSGGFANFIGQSKFMDTGIAEQDSFTFLCVGKSAATLVGTDLPAYISTYGADTASPAGTRGSSLYIGSGNPSAPTGVIFNGTFHNPTTPTQSTTPRVNVTDITVPRFMATSIDSTSLLKKTYDKTSGGFASVTATNAREKNSIVTTRLGSAASGSFLGSNSMAFAAIYNRQLSDAEVNTDYLFVKNFLTLKFSITI